MFFPLIKKLNVFYRDAIQQEIEQVKKDIRKIGQQKELENNKKSKGKDKKRSYIELQREQYLVSGKAHATKKRKENQDSVSIY